MVKDSGYKHRLNLLLDVPFLRFEARELARNYSLKQLRTLPYLQSLIKSRRLMVINYLKRGLSVKEIRERIYAFYNRKKYQKDNKPDIWSLIRAYRKEIIAKGGDPSPGVAPRRGSHHPKGSGISKGNLDTQRKKRSHHKSKSFGSRYEEKQGR